MSLSIAGVGKNAAILAYLLRNYSAIKNSGVANNAIASAEGGNFDVDAVAAGDASGSVAAFTISLVTKYFSADVACSHVDEADRESCSREAVILVIPEDGELALSSWVGEIANDLDIPLRLLVSLKTDQDQEEEDNSKYVIWGLDNSFEYINIALKSICEGWKDREKEGFPRLIEAMESHIWSSASKEKPKEKPREKLSVSPLSSSATAPATTATTVFTSVENASSVTATSNSDKIAEISIENPPAAATAATANSNSDKKSQEDLISAMIESMQKVSEEDADDPNNEMERLMEEARKCRDMARGGKMDDRTRREQAAAIALKLAGMMNLDEDSD